MRSASLLLTLPLLALAQSEQADPYAPLNATCPKDLAVIDAKGLSKEESKWREGRLKKVHEALGSYLENAKIPDFDISDFTRKLEAKDAPVVGLAISGGGTQSGVGGLGIWQAFDSRYAPAREAGTGGLTQLLSYLTGLSGGGAVTVAALSGNNFSSISELTQAVNFSVNYEAGPTGNVTQYFTELFENAGAKAEEGFPVSVSDVFGQWFGTYGIKLSLTLFKDKGASNNDNARWLRSPFRTSVPCSNLTKEMRFANFSDVALEGTAFSAHEAPMPLMSLAEVIPGFSPEIGGISYPGNNETNGFDLTAFEVSPLHFGSWAGGRVQAFFPTKYLGTNMSDGKPATEQCIVGFDKLTFIQGSTATAFNFYLIDDWFGIPLFAKRALSRLLGRQTSGNIVIPPDQVNTPNVELLNQIASNFDVSFGDTLWATYPNPFNNLKDAPTMKDDDYLTIVDGSEAGETIPLRPLMTPHRGLDLIIAYDSSSDALPYNWVNGTNLYNTYLASRESKGALPFPVIPDSRTLINSNATSRPTFFGCNATEEDNTPLVLYLPNYPWSAYSNFSYQKSSFTNIQLNVTLENAFNVATYGNGALPANEGANWPTCLACAVIKKSLHRAKIAEPAACAACWTQYCWDGKTDDAEPPTDDAGPRLALNASLGFAEWNRTVWEKEGDVVGVPGR